jgi:ABC-type transport system substrate-binding protein
MSLEKVLRLASVPVAMGLTAWLAGHALAAEDGKITIVMPEEPDIVDPCHASRSNIGRVVKQNVAETLTEINPDDGSITGRSIRKSSGN